MDTNENQSAAAADERNEPTARDGSANVETVRDYRGTGIMWTAVALVVALALFVIVALQNTQDVSFEFLWFDAEVPLILILAITFAAALLIGEAVGFVWRRRRRKQLRDRDELKRLRTQTG